MAVHCAGAASGADLSLWDHRAVPVRRRAVKRLMSEELRRQGYIVGQNLTVDCYEFGPNTELSSEHARKLVNAKVDVIIAWGDVALRAAQQATKTIPILAMTDDMLAEGLVNSLARPNGNTTGVTIVAAELDGKRQEILIEAVPGLHGMAVLADTSAPDVKLRALQEAAQARNIELSVHRIAKAEDVAAAIDTAKTSGSMALTSWRHRSFGAFVT